MKNTANEQKTCMPNKKSGIVVLKKGAANTRFSKFGKDGCCVYNR